MKILSLETSKRLEPYLKNIDVELYYCWEKEENEDDAYVSGPTCGYEWTDHPAYCQFNNKIKTLTLEEALDLLPKTIFKKNLDRFMSYCKVTGFDDIKRIEYDKYIIKLGYYNRIFIKFDGETLLEAVEKMINYLLDENLLPKK